MVAIALWGKKPKAGSRWAFLVLVCLCAVMGCRGTELDCYDNDHCPQNHFCHTHLYLCLSNDAEAEECPMYYEDNDKDGWGGEEIGRLCWPPDDPDAVMAGGDCDDNDSTVNPGMEEIPYNGKDNDCDPTTPHDDLDGDGFLLADDCDDLDDQRFPGNPDTCPGNGIDNDCDLIPDNGPGCYVEIGPGEYSIGKNEGDQPWHPLRKVKLSGFKIMAYQVTNAQVAEAIKRNDLPDTLLQRTIPHGYPENYATDERWAFHPAVGLSHNEASMMCQAMGGDAEGANAREGRLPTEAEWEAAARGPDARIYPWGGATPTPDCNHANYARCTQSTGPEKGPIAVNALPNGCTEWGLCGMAGNVREWVSDWYDPNYYESLPPLNEAPVEDPTGPSGGGGIVLRSVRGGSWLSSEDEITTYYREGGPSGSTGAEDLGFRCVLQPTE